MRKNKEKTEIVNYRTSTTNTINYIIVQHRYTREEKKNRPNIKDFCCIQMNIYKTVQILNYSCP